MSSLGKYTGSDIESNIPVYAENNIVSAKLHLMRGKVLRQNPLLGQWVRLCLVCVSRMFHIGEVFFPDLHPWRIFVLIQCLFIIESSSGAALITSPDITAVLANAGP